MRFKYCTSHNSPPSESLNQTFLDRPGFGSSNSSVTSFKVLEEPPYSFKRCNSRYLIKAILVCIADTFEFDRLKIEIPELSLVESCDSLPSLPKTSTDLIAKYCFSFVSSTLP